MEYAPVVVIISHGLTGRIAVHSRQQQQYNQEHFASLKAKPAVFWTFNGSTEEAAVHLIGCEIGMHMIPAQPGGLPRAE